MHAHFVEFFSPGTFVSEKTTRPIETWDVEAASAMAVDIIERHAARPFGFRFITKPRGDDDLDSKIIESSAIYYLGGKVRTLAEVEADNDPSEAILRRNMRNNGYDRVITNTNSWKFTAPLHEKDIVLDFVMPEREAQP